jgi:hypothetical protein
MVLSVLPEARILPSGLNATEVTEPAAPVRGWPMGLPVAASHSLIVPSALPEARSFPSGLNATELTEPAAPVRGWPMGL